MYSERNINKYQQTYAKIQNKLDWDDIIYRNDEIIHIATKNSRIVTFYFRFQEYNCVYICFLFVYVEIMIRNK